MSEVQVDGLKTPALTDGEFTGSQTDNTKLEASKKHTALQVAQSLEAKIHELTATVEKDEKTLATRLKKMSDLIEELLGKISPRESAKE